VTSVPAAVLSMLECVVFMVLSFLEHMKSVGSPMLLDVYLLLSILFDAVRIRTLWLDQIQTSIAGIFTVCMVVKMSVLVLEESSKRRWLLPSQLPWSTEVTGGIFSRTLFLWLDRMMYRGYSRALSVITLPDIDANLLSQALWERIGPRFYSGKYSPLVSFSGVL
jgi:ATP-binding cassette, subfamily C (CFTR/MRP), member 1